MTVSMPIPELDQQRSICSKRIYNLHRCSDGVSITAGYGVYSLDGLCPTFASPNQNMFCNLFGIEFAVGDDNFVRPISPYEFASAFNLGNEMTSHLSHPRNHFLLDCGIPGCSSFCLCSSLFTDTYVASGKKTMKQSSHLHLLLLHLQLWHLFYHFSMVLLVHVCPTTTNGHQHSMLTLKLR